MWIMLNAKLPTQVSPPKMSIFWAEPWTDSPAAAEQVEDFLKTAEWDFMNDENGKELPSAVLREKAKMYLAQQNYAAGGLGLEPNFNGAVGINYKGERLRVFPNEFSALSQENMALYIGNSGVDASHLLVPDTSAQQKIVSDILDGQSREIYDAAMLDGCNHEQAITTALGVDITNPLFMANFPVAGWYKCRKEYAEIFCSEYEMQETDKRAESDGYKPEPKTLSRSAKRTKALNRTLRELYA